MAQAVGENAGEPIIESNHRACSVTGAITDAIDDGMGMVRHVAKYGCDAAEEFLNDTAGRLQRHLALTIAATFGAGVAAGALIGWVVKRR